MSMVPHQNLVANTLAHEQFPLVKATGFREYDACWVFEKDVNLYGIQAIGEFNQKI